MEQIRRRSQSLRLQISDWITVLTKLNSSLGLDNSLDEIKLSIASALQFTKIENMKLSVCYPLHSTVIITNHCCPTLQCLSQF